MKGEFELIDEIKKMFPVPGGLEGIGDDCAVIPQKTGWETLVSTDMLVEGSHFLISEITPYQLGWKSAAVNFSDIAAMGGIPVGSFLAVALPKTLPEGWMEEFLKGYKDISEKYGFPLLGGDTTSSPDRLSICVTAMGKALAGRSRKRGSAKPGDLVCVTGFLGDSAAGLHAVLNGAEKDDIVAYLLECHYLPLPRIEEGIMLSREEGVHAMMDISDGVGSDLRHILDESGVGAVIDTGALPTSMQMEEYCDRNSIDKVETALCGGEDYELLFTVSEEAEARLDVRHTVIGVITEEKGLVWKGSEKDYMGFRHF